MLTYKRAIESDADRLADAHIDSIRAAGPAFYAANGVEAWQSGIDSNLYLQAMDRGEVFFIATTSIDGVDSVLGFSSDYRIEGHTHGTSVYVRGSWTRQGLGSRLLQMAEDHARTHGAREIRIDASLAGVAFYRRQGYEELGRGETELTSGYDIDTVSMRKLLR